MWFKLALLISVCLLMILIRAGGRKLVATFCFHFQLSLTSMNLVGESQQSAATNGTSPGLITRSGSGINITAMALNYDVC
jgi:hypothetical protein